MIKKLKHVLFGYLLGNDAATLFDLAASLIDTYNCLMSIVDLLATREYHSLLCLLCLDFPFTPVQKTARYSSLSNVLLSCLSTSLFVIKSVNHTTVLRCLSQPDDVLTLMLICFSFLPHCDDNPTILTSDCM